MMQKSKRVVIKEELVQLTQHRDEAVILNQFLYWTPRTRDYSKFVNEEASATGVTDYGWIFKKAEELMEELLMIDTNVKTVRKYLKNLVDKGYLLRRRNPVNKYDKTYQYRINLKLLVNDLTKLGYELEGFEQCTIVQNTTETNQIGSPEVTISFSEADKMDVSKSKNTSAIPEITLDITNKEYISNKEIKKETGVVIDDNAFKEIKQLYLKFSKDQSFTHKDEQLIKEMLATDLDVKVIFDLMNRCYEQVKTIRNHKGIWSFNYVKKYIEETISLQQEQTTNSTPSVYEVPFLGINANLNMYITA